MPLNVNILNAAQNSNLFAIQNTQSALNTAQLQLSTGQRVNSALDNPNNFFTALSLSSEATGLNKVLDNLSQSITTIQTADNARASLDGIINLASSNANDAITELRTNQSDIGSIILADNPVVYFRLDETSGTTATNLGSGGAALNGTYNGGVTFNTGALSFNLSTSASFDGVNGRVDIPSSPLINQSATPARTVELTFQADDLTGRQVLYEEGGTTNAIALYLDDNRIFFNARDSGDFGPFNISTEIEVGRTYQAAFTLDAANLTFTGYLDGEVVGTGALNGSIAGRGAAVAIGRNSGGTFFADGPEGGNGEYFQGRIADFALYNSVLSQEDLQARVDNLQIQRAEFFQNEVNELINQFQGQVEDSIFQGVNLLNNNDLRTSFNRSGSSSLITQGVDFTTSGIGFTDLNFNSFENIQQSINEIDIAQSAVQDFGTALSNDLNLINAREEFTRDTISNLQGAREDLLAADQNEVAAEVLSLQTQQQLQITTLSLSTQGTNIGDLLAQPNPLFSQG
ncbi:MAG: LamG-like jellyroll fold domain-containing protein [Pseudomonadota bacterium]